MKEANFIEILKILENGKLNLGILSHVYCECIVEFGYSYEDNKLTLYAKGASIPKIIFNEKVTFYKWAEEKMIKGEGIVKILETKEEKETGVKHIMKRQTETKREKYIDRNEINNMNILEIDVKKIYIC